MKHALSTLFVLYGTSLVCYS